MFIKRKALAIAITAAMSAAAFPTVSNAKLSDMQSFFNEMGAYGTASGANSFRGQTRNYMAGGNLTMRVPNKTYQLATMDPPRIGSSCSGIDIYGGSFSFINSDQLVQMMQNIGNNAAGAIFTLALDAVAPALAATLKFFQDMANKINALNINSCQAATGIVNSVREMKLNQGLEAQLKSFGNLSGIADDWSQMTESFQSAGSGAPKATANAAKGSSLLTDEEKKWLEPGNLLWRAMGKVTTSGAGISENEKKLIQAMLGTVILQQKEDKDGKMRLEARHYPPLFIDPVTQFLGKDQLTDNVTTEVYRCGGTDCSEIYPSTELLNSKSISKIVRDRVEGIRDRMRSRSQNEVGSDDYQIFNMTSLPVWTMLESDYRTGGVLQTLNNAQELIAISYIEAVLNRVLREVTLGVGVLQVANLDAGVGEHLAEMSQAVRYAHREIQDKTSELNRKFNVYMTSRQALEYETIRVKEQTAELLRLAKDSAK